jgi:IS1 family transposase
MRGLKLNHLQLDEIWTFVQKKQAMIQPGESSFGIGDQYMYVAIDEKTKLIPTFALGKRDSAGTRTFIRDLSERIVTDNPQNLHRWIYPLRSRYPGVVR